MKTGKAGFGTCLTHSVDVPLGLGIIQSGNLKTDAFQLTQAQREAFLAYRDAGLTGRQSSVITLACDAHFSRYHKLMFFNKNSLFIQHVPERSNQNLSLVIQVTGKVFCLLINC